MAKHVVITKVVTMMLKMAMMMKMTVKMMTTVMMAMRRRDPIIVFPHSLNTASI